MNERALLDPRRVSLLSDCLKARVGWRHCAKRVFRIRRKA
jgi:hypothetical protein